MIFLSKAPKIHPKKKGSDLGSISKMFPQILQLDWTCQKYVCFLGVGNQPLQQTQRDWGEFSLDVPPGPSCWTEVSFQWKLEGWREGKSPVVGHPKR